MLLSGKESGADWKKVTSYKLMDIENSSYIQHSLQVYEYNFWLERENIRVFVTIGLFFSPRLLRVAKVRAGPCVTLCATAI
jgi:hypothetical protein